MASKRTSGQSQSKSTAADVQALAQQENCNGLLPIVGIGASAGGLEAFTQLLRHLPTDTGMAFVLIHHLDPNHESLLCSLQARTTQMPVTQVQDGMIVALNQVYVIPPNAKMTLLYQRDSTERATFKQKSSCFNGSSSKFCHDSN